MPEYLSPGVYVEEIDTGPVPIEGVSTSTAGFVGMTAQGPVDGLPQLVTSFGEFTRLFGGYLPESYDNMRFLPNAVQGFFDNGGLRVYIKRVVANSGGPKAASSTNLKDGLLTRLSKDAKKGDTDVRLGTLRGIQAGDGTVLPTTLTFTQIKDGLMTTESGIKVKSYDDSTKTVTLDLKEGLKNGYEARYTTVSTDVPDPIATTPPKLSADAKKDDTQVHLTTLRGMQVGTQLTFTEAATTEKGTVTELDYSTKTVTLKDKLQNPYTAASTTVTGPSAPLITISAVNPGAWGNTLSIQVFHVSTTKAQVNHVHKGDPSKPDPTPYDTVELTSAANFYSGAIVEFNTGNIKHYSKVKKVDGKTIILNTSLGNTQKDADTALALDIANNKTIASTCEFRLTVTSNSVAEDYPVLTLDSKTPYYIGNQINGQSSLISVTGSDDVGEDPFTMPSTDDGLNVRMGGGADSGAGGGAVTFKADDYIGIDDGPGRRTGIQALEDIEQISIIAAPGITDQSVINELINQCTRLRYRFAILDPDYTQAQKAMDEIQTQRGLYDTRYAALYFPRLKIRDPLLGKTIPAPPSGHMAGIYARTDIERGVYKAPANEVIQGILDLDLTINKGEQDILNPQNINVLRDFRHQNRGLRVWGARCITSDAQWKYVNVRRLFIFIEASLDQGTQWVVFEPNDYPLWARVKQSITNFLTTVWHDGALMGQKAEEAFFVKVDRSTMTQDDIDNGRLIILVGIAPVKPAEFVIIRISQFTATASTTGQ